MAAVLAQDRTASTRGAASLSVGSAQGWAAPTAGNTLLAWASGDATVTVNNTMTAGPSIVDNNAVYMWWKVAAGTETTFTFTPGASTSPVAVGVMEISGLAASPFDIQNSASTGSGTSTPSVGVTTTGASGDFLVALAGMHHGAVGSAPSAPSWTNGFTNIDSVDTGTVATTDCAAFIGTLSQGTAGAISTVCSWTGGVNDSQALIIAFKLAAAGGAPALPVFATFIGPT
jgi:hypothetical protein